MVVTISFSSGAEKGGVVDAVVVISVEGFGSVVVLVVVGSTATTLGSEGGSTTLVGLVVVEP